MTMSASNRPSGLRQFRLLLAKDLRQEFRTREMLTSMGLYAFLVLIVLGVAFTQVDDTRVVSNLAGGLVWVIIVFAALLGLGRAFAHEQEGGGSRACCLRLSTAGPFTWRNSPRTSYSSGLSKSSCCRFSTSSS